MVRKILIATDGSPHASKAVDLGADLAAKYAAEVVLVHVLLRDDLSENLRHMVDVEYRPAEGGKWLAHALSQIPDSRFPITDLAPVQAETEEMALRAVADRILADAEDRVRRRGVGKVEKRIEDGNPVKRILAVAEAVGPDMIVTGARGLSDLKALVVGSVSHKLAHLAPTTCITVR